MEYLQLNLESSPITPVRPVAPYVGGKRNLANRIIERINATPHVCYAEAFVGMGGVFFRRDRVPQSEVINDFSRDVATLFRILQRHYPQFMDTLKFQLAGRAEFERLLATDPNTLTDLERSARFLYLQRTSFGGKIVGRTFGYDATKPARFDITKLGSMLEDVHARLARVTIESLDFEDFIRRYDRPATLFYLDPPYWDCEGYYGKIFSRADFERLATVLRGIQGRFILSLNDTPGVRETFAGFDIEGVDVTYSLTRQKGGGPFKEVIITGGR